MSKSSNQKPSQSGPGLKSGLSGVKVHKPDGLGKGGNVSPNSASRGKQGNGK